MQIVLTPILAIAGIAAAFAFTPVTITVPTTMTATGIGTAAAAAPVAPTPVTAGAGPTQLFHGVHVKSPDVLAASGLGGNPPLAAAPAWTPVTISSALTLTATGVSH